MVVRMIAVSRAGANKVIGAGIAGRAFVYIMVAQGFLRKNPDLCTGTCPNNEKIERI